MQRRAEASPPPPRPSPGVAIASTSCSRQQDSAGSLASLLSQAAEQGGSLKADGRASGEAVIVEVRRLRRLPSALLHFRELLPPHWGVTLIHGSQNAADIWMTTSRALKAHLQSGRVRLRPLPPRYMLNDAERVHASRAQGGELPNQATFDRQLSGPLKSNLSAARLAQLTALHETETRRVHKHARRWYNDWLQEADFWNMFESEHVLLFEADAVLCPQPTLPLDWWAGRYAYVGSPWYPMQGVGMWWCKAMPCCVGNSGLSLWHRPAIASLLTNRVVEPVPGRLLDYWIAKEVQSAGAAGELPSGIGAVPPEELAGAFSVGEPPDHWYGAEEYTPFGMHGVHNWPQTRGQSRGPTCGVRSVASAPAKRRCEMLLSRCPAIQAIVLNESLSGERYDQPAEADTVVPSLEAGQVGRRVGDAK